MQPLRRFVISLASALVIPVFAALLILWWEGEYPDYQEFRTALLIFGPFTLAGSLLVVWPAYALQPIGRSEMAKAAVVLAISIAAGIVMLLPFSDGGGLYPWPGAIFASATAILWLALERFLRRAFATRKKDSSLG